MSLKIHMTKINVTVDKYFAITKNFFVIPQTTNCKIIAARSLTTKFLYSGQ